MLYGYVRAALFIFRQYSFEETLVTLACLVPMPPSLGKRMVVILQGTPGQRVDKACPIHHFPL